MLASSIKPSEVVPLNPLILRCLVFRSKRDSTARASSFRPSTRRTTLWRLSSATPRWQAWPTKMFTVWAKSSMRRNLSTKAPRHCYFEMHLSAGLRIQSCRVTPKRTISLKRTSVRTSSGSNSNKRKSLRRNCNWRIPSDRYRLRISSRRWN